MRRNRRIREVEDQLAELPRGNLVYKKIRGKQQPYLQWSEQGKTVSKYVKVAEREEILRKLEVREKLRKELEKLQTQTEEADSFHLQVVRGEELSRMIRSVETYEKRDSFSSLENFIRGDYPGKVCILYGLRRTGKTTLCFQLAASLSAEELEKAAYIKAGVANTMADMNHDLQLLDEAGCRYVFIDEVTLMEDFIDSAALFSDIYAMRGMKIVLSGTDSLGFWFTLKNELYDRAFMIHTTYIPFHEYVHLLGRRDIDEYIRFGGMLKKGETAFDDEAFLSPDVSFRDDESTRRYIDTAICENIQHSLACCRDGRYFRHLQDLYEEDELTGAINRLIEAMNHQFLLSVLTRKFKSHDLGSAAELLRKQPDPEKRTDILDHIDREAVTRALMRMLEIKNREDQKIGITRTHMQEIREYLKALDLIMDLPAETSVAGGEPQEYVIFTQPGMRYCQAQALVHVLMQDPIFSTFSLRERDLACDRILEDVRGRMMEDIVLLETGLSLPRTKRAFKLTFARSEFDMVIFDHSTYTCEVYEIKHSQKRTPRQYRTLVSEEECAQTEKIYGPITRRAVIYRGESGREGEVDYLNVEDYLMSLGKQ